jgi:3',5'-cyclic AMP phosphodiesterase CpdA
MKKNMKKNMLWMLLSLMAAAIMMPLSATAQEAQTQTTRIAVVSDIHVMAPSLLPEGAKVEGTEWTDDYANERKMLEQSAGLFDQFVETMSTEKPDILLITGDLTKDGELASHNYVKAGLQTLEAEGINIQVYVIPGNHDITTGTVYKYGNDGKRSALENDKKMTTTAAFASFYEDYGYDETSSIRDENSLSYMVEIDDGLYLLAIDSHDDGSVSQATLEWIHEKASGKRVIAMMHHPLFPHIEGADMFISTYTVANYVTVRNALINAGVNVILTGHFHTSDIAYDWDDDATVTNKGIYDINTGSLISYPCDYRMLTLSADKKTLSVKTKSLTPENWTADQCKSWLHERIASKTKTIVNNKISSLPSISKPMAEELATENVKDDIAQFSADLFILHAEGNEKSSADRARLMETYNSYYNEELVVPFLGTTYPYRAVFEYGGITDASIYSILDDKSNYDNDHENQTADRAIVIDLANPDPSNLLLELDNNDDNNSIINYYNGKTATVTLTGRTLLKDGAWNTICLPFSLTAEQISTSLSPEADIRALNTADFDNETLILNFTRKAPADGSVTTIDAGRPYIIKWANTNETIETITDPKFTGVTIDNTPHIDGTTNVLTFRGTYAWQQFTDINPTILLIGKNTSGKSTLFYPTNGISLATLGAFRAYFQFADRYAAYVSEDPAYGPGIRNFVLNFGDDDSATGIIAIGNSQSSTLNAQRSEWFTLDGRRLAAKPTAKGLYIHAGRKVVIK